MRAGPVLAIAWRDLRAELSGRQGLGMPLIALALLGPAALLPAPELGQGLPVAGEVPDAVLALPEVHRASSGTGFRVEDGVTVVYAWRVPPPIRQALDGPEPAVRVEELGHPLPVPGRSVLFALIAASTLTGAISASIAGERARHTLQALLSAAVTRLEIVAGKWLAWTAFGGGAAALSGMAAVLAGRQAPGPWLLALPMVPALIVAVGLWVVRRTDDVIAGTSVALRSLPAVLAASGALAWGLNGVHPLLAAAVPLGGALMAAGDLWGGGWAPTLVALASSALATGLLLVGTARDLNQDTPRDPSHRVRPIHALLDGSLALAAWWMLVPGPVLWGWAGNPGLTAALSPAQGLLAGAATLGGFAAVRAARILDPAARPRWGRPSWRAAVAALGVVASTALPAPTLTHPWVAQGAERLALGLNPPAAVGLFVILAQELWFRGFMQTRAGAIATTIAWAVVTTPHHPLAGLAGGALLSWAARDGVSSAVVARLAAWGALAWLAGFG